MPSAAADGENDSPNGDGSSKFSKEIKRPIGESAEKQSASKPNQIIQPTVLFDCGMLPPAPSLTATGGAGGLVFPPNAAITNTSGLTQPMQNASMARPPSPITATPVFANESSADVEAVTEAAANYTTKYEEATAQPAVRSGMVAAEQHEANTVEF